MKKRIKGEMERRGGGPDKYDISAGVNQDKRLKILVAVRKWR